MHRFATTSDVADAATRKRADGPSRHRSRHFTRQPPQVRIASTPSRARSFPSRVGRRRRFLPPPRAIQSPSSPRTKLPSFPRLTTRAPSSPSLRRLRRRQAWVSPRRWRTPPPWTTTTRSSSSARSSSKVRVARARAVVHRIGGSAALSILLRAALASAGGRRGIAPRVATAAPARDDDDRSSDRRARANGARAIARDDRARLPAPRRRGGRRLDRNRRGRAPRRRGRGALFRHCIQRLLSIALFPTSLARP